MPDVSALQTLIRQFALASFSSNYYCSDDKVELAITYYFVLPFAKTN